MTALNPRKIAIVQTLVETAPDGVVRRLQQALAAAESDTPLAEVRDLVEAEAVDRRLRNLFLLPIAPLCVGDGTDPHFLTFPARALSTLWRGLKSIAPEVVNAAKAAMTENNPDEALRAPCDALTRLAANALRASDAREFETVRALCDAARPGGAQAFIGCIDIAPVVRRAIARLPDWVGHTGEDTTAAARLAYKDAVAIDDDAGPRFFEMLSAQLTPRWMVLRVISAVMDKPTERYLADSELGDFGEHVMSEIDQSLATISQLDLDAGPKTGRAVGRLVALIARQTVEVETCIELSRDHGWGHRIVNHKKALASIVEGRLREAEKIVGAAMPMETLGGARGRRTAPKLSAPPDQRTVTRALTLLNFIQEIRPSANYAGFSATHAKVTEKLGAAIDNYVEEVLDHVKTGDLSDLDMARSFLMLAADFCELVRNEKAAEVVRRRAAAACLPEASHTELAQAG